MSNIHLYKDQVLYSVREVLSKVKERGGTASTRFWQEEAVRLRGQWGTDVVNIARSAMGREGLIFEGRASETQMKIFVEQAKEHCADLLHAISEQRSQKEN